MAPKTKNSKRSFAAALTAAREELHWSISDLSAATRINTHTLMSYERGARSPRLENITVLADALGVTPNDLCLHHKTSTRNTGRILDARA